MITLHPWQITFWLTVIVDAFWPLKVIQGHRLLLQLKADIWLPISDQLSPKLYLTVSKIQHSEDETNHLNLDWSTGSIQIASSDLPC